MAENINYEKTIEKGENANKTKKEATNDNSDSIEDDIFCIRDNVRLVRPKDKRLERLKTRRSQFSSSSSYSEGSVDGETGITRFSL